MCNKTWQLAPSHTANERWELNSGLHKHPFHFIKDLRSTHVCSKQNLEMSFPTSDIRTQNSCNVEPKILYYNKRVVLMCTEF